MIKARSNHPTRGPLLLFGLSAENIKRLQSGQPIKINLTEMGMQGEVLIMYGQTEAAIVEELRQAGIELPDRDQWKLTDSHPQ